jgi:hypothetical protein
VVVGDGGNWPNSSPSAQLFGITSPQNTQTTVAVVVGVKRVVTAADWYALTTTTWGNWQLVPNGGSVGWSVGANDGFDQFYNSAGADDCHIQ